MRILWVIVAAVGGCLVGILGMCLFAARHSSDEQAIYILGDAAEAISEAQETQCQPL